MKRTRCFPYYILLAASSSLRSDPQASEAAVEVGSDAQLDHVISISANESLIGCILSLRLAGWLNLPIQKNRDSC